jgi:predicted dehydrogenase
MLEAAQPDIVSVCTYAGSHRSLFEQCLAGGVKAIWCEKPLCLTMDDGIAMLLACQEAYAKMIVNHYRRYLHLFREAKRILDEGAIGSLSIIISSIADWDLMEWGTHWLDMIRFFAGDQRVLWVMGQARCTGEKKRYGHVMEQHAICYFAFADGVRGFLDGGLATPGESALKIIGREGTLDLQWNSKLILMNRGGLREVPVRSSLHGPRSEYPEEDGWQILLNDFIQWQDGGPEPHVCVRNALASTKLYLAAYESAKIGNRIDPPLGTQSQFPLDEIAIRQSGI